MHTIHSHTHTERPVRCRSTEMCKVQPIALINDLCSVTLVTQRHVHCSAALIALCIPHLHLQARLCTRCKRIFERRKAVYRITVYITLCRIRTSRRHIHLERAALHRLPSRKCLEFVSATINRQVAYLACAADSQVLPVAIRCNQECLDTAPTCINCEPCCLTCHCCREPFTTSSCSGFVAGDIQEEGAAGQALVVYLQVNRIFPWLRWHIEFDAVTPTAAVSPMVSFPVDGCRDFATALIVVLVSNLHFQARHCTRSNKSFKRRKCIDSIAMYITSLRVCFIGVYLHITWPHDQRRIFQQHQLYLIQAT